MKRLLNKVLFHHVMRDHVGLGVLASLSMYPFFGVWGCVLFVAATVLIDLDHYVHFLFLTRFRYWSFTAMFLFFEEIHHRRYRPELLVVEYLHNVEVFSLIVLAAFFWGGAFVPIFWGTLFHEFVDMVRLIHQKIPTRRCHSLIEYAWRIRKLRARGLDPEVLFEEARQATGLL